MGCLVMLAESAESALFSPPFPDLVYQTEAAAELAVSAVSALFSPGTAEAAFRTLAGGLSDSAAMMMGW